MHHGTNNTNNKVIFSFVLLSNYDTFQKSIKLACKKNENSGLLNRERSVETIFYQSPTISLYTMSRVN